MFSPKKFLVRKKVYDLREGFKKKKKNVKLGLLAEVRGGRGPRGF